MACFGFHYFHYERSARLATIGVPQSERNVASGNIWAISCDMFGSLSEYEQRAYDNLAHAYQFGAGSLDGTPTRELADVNKSNAEDVVPYGATIAKLHAHFPLTETDILEKHTSQKAFADAWDARSSNFFACAPGQFV